MNSSRSFNVIKGCSISYFSVFLFFKRLVVLFKNTLEKFSKFHEKNQKRKLMLILSFIKSVNLDYKSVVYEDFPTNSSKRI